MLQKTANVKWKMQDRFNNISNTNKILVIVSIVISVSLAGLGISLICATVNINSKCDAINDSVDTKFDSINTEFKAINQRFDYKELLGEKYDN